MLHKGDTIILKDLALNGSITTDNCTQKHYYLIILALPFGHQAHVESVLQNNWKAVPLNVKCGGKQDTIDILPTVKYDFNYSSHSQQRVYNNFHSPGHIFNPSS